MIAVCLLWNSVAIFVKPGNSNDRLATLPVVFSTKTCKAPTVTVLATKAETTPKARVNPKDFRGGSGERKFAKKANAVVTTDKVRASLRIEKERTQASAGLSESSLAFSYAL